MSTVPSVHLGTHPDLASCTVTLLVHCNDGTDMELEKTLSKEATSFTLNGETVTRSAYNQTVERAGLQGSLHLLPQRLIQQIATSDGRKFAKIFEAFCDNPSKVEFGEESQKQLADCQRNVQQLKQRITTQRKALRSIGCLEHLDPEYRPKVNIANGTSCFGCSRHKSESLLSVNDDRVYEFWNS